MSVICSPPNSCLRVCVNDEDEIFILQTIYVNDVVT